MTTVTLDIPNQENKYREILNYFVVNYNITELEQIKDDIDFSKNLYKEYQNDKEGQKDSLIVNTDWKNKEEVLWEIKNKLWN